jgi:hypothetical protein
MVRLLSNISFLRTCKSLKIIPNGLRATNVLKNTFNSSSARKLADKHSRQWLQLTIDSQYHRLAKIRRYIFQLNHQEHLQIVNFQDSLQQTKQCKLQQLLHQRRDKQNYTEQKPQGFKNLSKETLDTDLINVLNKGPSFVNAEPKELSKLCLLAKANL